MQSRFKAPICAFASALLWVAAFGQNLVSDLTVQRTVTATGIISPAQLTANTDNWAPTNFSKTLTVRLSTDASRNLTGLAGGAAGRIVTLENIGSQNLVLKNASSSSTVGNRFALAADYTLAGSTHVVLLYDGTASRWTILGYQPGTATGSVTNSGGSLTSNALVLGAGSSDTKVTAGLNTDGTSKLILGVAGTSVGSVDFKNATSGTINLAPPTGALGTVSLTLPLGGTLATLDGSESLTNKKLGSLTSNGYVTTSSGDGTLSITTASGILDTIGSTQGQIAYRGASGWAVLAPGTSGQILKTQGAAANPIWFTSSSISPLTTKGDVWGFSTVDARLPVGSNNQILTADSSQTLGIKWAANPADMLVAQFNSEVSVTTTATLTISTWHICSGTSANYTATLPAASGNAGKFIGVRMAAGLTKLVTIKGNSAELINGSNTRIMWAGETAILLCDGTGWSKVAGRSIPMTCGMYKSLDQTITNSSVTRFLVNSVISGDDNTGLMADTSNNQITILRPGNYLITGSVVYGGSTSRVDCRIHKGGSDLFIISATGNASSTIPNAATRVPLVATDTIQLYCFQNSGSNLTAFGGATNSQLYVTEVPNW
jgi:hypothetical protein